MKPKHHLIISAILMAFLAMLAYAKKSEVIKSIRWHERSLSWNDFPIINAIPGDYHAMVYSDIQFEGNREEQYLHIYAQMLPHRSGRVVEDDLETDQLLIHEQNHFNITEYHARLFRKEVIELGRDNVTNNDLQRLGKKYLKKADVMQDRYDRESKHNIEWPAQRYWELHIAGLLRETAFYTNQDLYTYQLFLGGATPWFRNVYNTLEGSLLTSYPEKAENSHYGKVYYIEQKSDSTIVKYYLNGKPSNGGYFEAATTIITLPNNSTQEVHLFDAEGKPFSNATEAHITRTVTDADGNISRTYYDDKGRQVLSEGVFTQKGIWNAAKKSMYSSYYDKDDKPIMRRGAFYELREMGDNKVTKKISYFNSAGKPMRDTYAVSIYEYETDANLKVSSIKEFDVDGNYALGVADYNTVYEYNERGNMKSKSFFNELGHKTADMEGIHQYTFIYDRYDNCTDMRKFNFRGLPTKGVDDFHQLVNLYDTLGRPVFNAKYYPNYVLRFNEDKVGATTYEYVGDSIVNLKNIDVYGKEGIDNDGIMLTKQFLNDKKEVIKEEFFATDGTWAKTKNDVVSYHYRYDERGNNTEMAAFDSLGNPYAWQEDVSITRWEYDQNNTRNKTTYFTVADELANAEEGTTYNVFKYDDNNNLLERTNFDKNMNPSMVDGAFRTSGILNSFGKDSIVMMYGVNNKLLTGVAIIKYDYNQRGVLISESTYNQHNQAILNNYSIHKTVYIHDKYDRYIGTAYYGINDEKVNGTDGFSSMELALNNSGFVRNLTYYDAKKRPVLGPNGFHKLESHYNDMDEIVRTSTYGSDQELLNNEEGIADYIYQIDTSGRTLRISFYDSKGNLTEDSNGIAEYFYLPELNGLFFLEKQQNAKGMEVPIDAI